MLFKILFSSLFLLATEFASAAHLARNIRCVAADEVSKVTMRFQIVKANRLHRLTVDFRTDKATSGLVAGDKVGIVIDDVVVGQVKLRSVSRTVLKGRFRTQGFDPDFGIDVERRSSGEIANLACVFKR